MTKVLRSHPNIQRPNIQKADTQKTDVRPRLTPRKAIEGNAPTLCYDPGSVNGERIEEPAGPICSQRGAFFIAGYKPSAGAPAGIAALVLAAYCCAELVQTGTVEAGIIETGTIETGTIESGVGRTKASKLKKTLDRLRWKRKAPPIRILRASTADANTNDIVWVYPTLIAEIRFFGWGESDELEHPIYEGLSTRQDNADVFRLDRRPSQAGETDSQR